MFLILWLAFLSIWAVCIRYGQGLRAGFLAAHVINGILIVLATEALSIFQALTFWPLWCFWSFILMFNLFLLHRRRSSFLGKFVFAPLDKVEKVIILGAGVIVTVTGFIAMLAPPNNYDSMVYHLARVAHWAYNGTVANYPTNTLLQLVIPPYSEYAILQGYILGGSDHMANLVQWASFVASLAGVSLIAQMLGAPRRGQLLAVLCAATLPMGILQASSTQNDLLATLWAVCMAVFSLQLVRTGCLGWGILCAFALALAALTKGTAVILGTPFVCWALWKVKESFSRKLVLGAFVFVALLAVNAAFWSRLTELDPHPLAAMRLGGSALVERLDVRGTVSNAVRGVATELAWPSAPWQQQVQSWIETVHRWIGLDIHEPAFTVSGSRFAVRYCAFSSEEYTASQVHSIIYLGVALGLFWVRPRKRGLGGGGAVGGVKLRGEDKAGPGELFRPFLSIFIMAVLIYWTSVKWQEGIVRFHLPFYVMFSAVAGVVVGRISGLYQMVLCGLMLATALLPLLNNQQRSLLPYGAVNRQDLEIVPRGGMIFDRLMREGFFRTAYGTTGYLQDNVRDRLANFVREVCPGHYRQVMDILQKAPSFSCGFWLIPRAELLFARFGKVDRDVMFSDGERIKRLLEKYPACQDIGYVKGSLQYEYPLWSLLQGSLPAARIEHIQVDNVSRKFAYPRGEPEPCLIIKEGLNEEETLVYKQRTYRRCSAGPMQIYADERILGLDGLNGR